MSVCYCKYITWEFKTCPQCFLSFCLHWHMYSTVCMCVLRQMVECWWKTNYWRQVKGRPGRVVINMLVSIRHSIMALNHPLPMLHCRTVFGQDRAVCSEPRKWPYCVRSERYQDMSRCLQIRSLFSFHQSPTRSHRQSCRHSCWIWYSLRFKSAYREGIHLTLPFLPLWNEITRPLRWSEGKYVSSCHFKMKAGQCLSCARLQTIHGSNDWGKYVNEQTHIFHFLASLVAQLLNLSLTCITVERPCC